MTATAAAAYGVYRLYEYYRWYYGPELQEAESTAYFQRTGWTAPHETDDPYTLSEADYRPFGLENVVVDLEVWVDHPSRELTAAYSANEVNVKIRHISRDRMYTGHQGKKTPQGHHLFSFEMLMMGIESFSGTASALVSDIGEMFRSYAKLPNQTRQATTLLRNSDEALLGMSQRKFSLDAWRTLLKRVIVSYVQIQQYSAHSTSGYGSGGQSENSHKEELRKLEVRLERGDITKLAAIPIAASHLEKLFDLHGNQKLGYRQLSQGEGIYWLRKTYPKVMALKSWNFIDE